MAVNQNDIKFFHEVKKFYEKKLGVKLVLESEITTHEETEFVNKVLESREYKPYLNNFWGYLNVLGTLVADKYGKKEEKDKVFIEFANGVSALAWSLKLAHETMLPLPLGHYDAIKPISATVTRQALFCINELVKVKELRSDLEIIIKKMGDDYKAASKLVKSLYLELVKVEKDCIKTIKQSKGGKKLFKEIIAEYEAK